MLGLSAFVSAIFQCIPVDAFWTKMAGRLGGRCLDSLSFFIITGSLNAGFNFILLAMPIPLLWRLRTSILQKLILTVIFVIGLT